jgi:hypothetical protein
MSQKGQMSPKHEKTTDEQSIVHFLYDYKMNDSII